jgi:hypothetical protein
MSLPHQSSEPATIPELDIFNLPLTQTANESEYCLQIRPISTITANSVVEFVFGGEGRDYLDLARSRLYVKLKLVHQDGSALTVQALKEDGTSDLPVPKMKKPQLSIWLSMLCGTRLMFILTGSECHRLLECILIKP